MTTIAPYRRAELEHAQSARGTVNVLQLALDGIAADVRIDRVDRRTRSSWYALRLASAGSAITGRLVGELPDGELVELGTLEVPPGSFGSARFAVTAPRRAPYASLFLEIRSEDALLRAEVPQPPRRYGPNPIKTGAVCIAFGGAAASCAALLAGAFSHAPRVAAVTAAPSSAQPRVAPSRLPVARIVSFAARRDADAAGESVLASYLAVGDGGSVVLLDHAGKVVASAPFTRLGTTRVAVPATARRLPLVARLMVRHAGTDAVASVVLPPNVAPQSDVAAAAAARPASAVASLGDGIVAIAGRAVGGRPLSLRLLRGARATRVELQGESGATLGERIVPPEAPAATLDVPAVNAPTRYFLIAHFAHNGGEEMVVRGFTVHPAR